MDFSGDVIDGTVGGRDDAAAGGESDNVLSFFSAAGAVILPTRFVLTMRKTASATIKAMRRHLTFIAVLQVGHQSSCPSPGDDSRAACGIRVFLRVVLFDA